MNSAPNRPTHEHGFALLIVLFTLVLLGFLITQLLSAGRTQLAVAGNLKSAAIAAAAADGGIESAIARLDDGEPIGPARIGGLAVTLAVTSVAGRINPNTAPLKLLASLIQAVGVAPAQAGQLAAAIVAWRSPAASPVAQQALDARYRAAGLNDGPAGDGFPSRQALGSVIGMTPVLLARLLPHLSLFAPPVPVAAEADPVVRMALQRASPLDVPGGAVEGPRVAMIEATAFGPGHTRAQRCATVRLSPANVETPFTILQWRGGACTARH